MRNIFKKIVLGLSAAVLLCGCEEDINYVSNRHSTPTINSIVINNGDQIEIPGKLDISYDLSDLVAPLSTLEIKVRNKDVTYVVDKIRTKGNSVKMDNYQIDFPFLADISEDMEAEVIFTLVNVDGNWSQLVKKLKVKRPTLPETLYFVTEEESYPMTKVYGSELYSLDDGAYPSSMSGFIATDESLDDAEYIWGSGGKSNKGAIVADRFSEKLTISFGTWIVSAFTFSPYSFEVGVEGMELNISINGTQLQGDGQYLYGKVQFTKGTEFSIVGLDASNMYNRDFMQFNSATGNYTFTGETGSWEIFFSYTYQYFWVCRMDEVSPATYWMIGNGFCCAPNWMADHPGGWDFDDIKQMGYFKNLGNGTYQLTTYISSGFDLQMYKLREWDTEFKYVAESAITAPAGILIHSKLIDLVESDGFIPGYYKLMFTPESPDIQMVITQVVE